MAEEMDRAQQIELETLKLQDRMNEIIDFGNSDIQKFYHDSVIFVTGASGFLGKQLVEKLLRSCQLKKLFVLLRSKKGKNIQERLEYLLKEPLYDLLRKKCPNFVEKLVPIEGNIADERLGISDKDWTTLTKEVDTIFHMAATVRFDEPLKTATLTNVRGTRECLTLARECKNLKNFVYVSTAFSHATSDKVGVPLLEKFYPCPIPPEAMISLAESMDEDRINAISNDLMKRWPNSYTFTKAIAEEVVRTADDLPVCVVRPPIVIASYYEPYPAWMDLSVLSGPTGILTGIILGVLHVFLVRDQSKLPLTPVDIVNNATIAAAWDAEQRRKSGNKDVQIYTVSNINRHVTWGFIGKLYRTEGVKYSTPKAVWYCYVIETPNKFFYWFLSIFLHYIPAYVMDAVGTLLGTMPKDITSYVSIYRKIDKFASIYNFFLEHDWGFQDDNLQKMVSKMSDADKIIFNGDINTIDYKHYVKAWGAVGIRKYIIKDGLKGSEVAYRKQMYFYKYVHYLLITFYVVAVSVIVYNVWNFVNYIF